MGKKTDKAPKSQSVGDAQDDNLSKTPGWYTFWFYQFNFKAYSL